MRPIILCGLFALAVVAVPIAFEIEHGKHLEKRGATDNVIADAVKAIVAFGAFIWGGNIIAKKAVNYYFDKKAMYDEAKKQKDMMDGAMIRTSRHQHKDGEKTKCHECKEREEAEKQENEENQGETAGGS